MHHSPFSIHYADLSTISMMNGEQKMMNWQ